MKRAASCCEAPSKTRPPELVAGLPVNAWLCVFKGFDSPSLVHRARVWSWFKHVARVCKELFFFVQRLRFKFAEALDLRTTTCIPHLDLFEELAAPSVKLVSIPLKHMSGNDWTALQILFIGPRSRFPLLDAIRFEITDSTRCFSPPLVIGAGARLVLRGQCREMHAPLFRLLPSARLDLVDCSAFSSTLFSGSRSIQEVRVSAELADIVKECFGDVVIEE